MTASNEPAFPTPNDPQSTGITIRDLFAAFALAGYLASSIRQERAGIARSAYRMADTMIACRDGRLPDDEGGAK
jgi:hypothetical protein